METVAIVQARLGSSRFPAKILSDLHGRSVLEWVVQRAGAARQVDRVVVATCRRGGPEVAEHCQQIGVECLVSSHEEDVLRRFVEATRHFRADLVVRVCSDNPLIVPAGIDELLSAWAGEDYVGYDLGGVPAITRPTGYFAEVATAAALERLDRTLAGDDRRREHVTQGLYQQPERFRCALVPAPPWYEGLGHAAVDTPEDLEHVRRIALEFDSLAVH